MEELDGGGWTLVWQHSYMEHLPLTHNMTFFSDYYNNCTTRVSGWCNIPNKARFSEATEQIIVEYHKGTVVYAYKGLLNRNIDYNWSGAMLLDFVKIVDKCTQANGLQPAPENRLSIGLTFDVYIHHTTTRLIVTHMQVHSQVLLNVNGITAAYHHLFQAATAMSK